MSENILKTRVQQKIDTTAHWETTNPILKNGELGFERTISGDIKIKVGDGLSTWSQLSYLIFNNSNSDSNIKYSNILLEKYRKTVTSSQYEETNDAIPDYVVSVTDMVQITNTTFINICKDSTNQYYLNSFDLPLTQVEFGQEMAEELVGAGEGITNMYSLGANFDISTFTPVDSNENFYLIILFEFDTIYAYQLITNLSIANAPTEWIIYQLNPDLIIEDKVQSNSKNLITSGAVQRALNNYQVPTTTEITENSTAIPTAGAVYSAISNLPSGGGASYTAGEGIKIENNIISTTYGDTTLASSTFHFVEPPELPNNQWRLEEADENLSINVIIMVIQSQYLDLVERPITFAFKNNGDIITTKTCTLNTTYTLWEGEENEVSFSYAAAGSDNFAKVMISEGEDTDAMAAIMEESTNNWWFCLVDTEDLNKDGYASLIFAAHEDILSSLVNSFDFIFQLPVTKKLPAVALTAGNGIKIEENATIGLNYGLSSEQEFIGDVLFGFEHATDPSNYYFGNLYGYYIYSVPTGWEPNTDPDYWTNDSLLKAIEKNNGPFDSPLKSLTGSSWHNTQYQSSIDYTTDTYIEIPLYLYDRHSSPPTSPNIVLKELPYDSTLYTYFANSLDDTYPNSNIFFGGTYNTNDSISDIISNGSITSNNSETAMLFLLLWQSDANQILFTIFTNNNNLNSSTWEDYRITSGEYKYIYNHVPYAIFNGKNNTDYSTISNYEIDNPANAIVFGDNNIYYTKNNKLLIIGNNNNLNYGIGWTLQRPSLVIGHDLQDSSGYDDPLVLIGEKNNTTLDSSIQSGTPYLVIGKGNSQNVLEVTSAGININGGLYVNGNAVSSRLDKTSLANYLSNNNYITSSYLSNNNYVTTSDLSGYVPTTRTINNNALSSNIILYATDIAISSSDSTKINTKFADYVPTTRTINGNALSSNITLYADGIKLASNNNTTIATALNSIPTKLSDLTNDLTYDNAPTANSNNLLSSGTVYISIDNVIQVANGKTASYVFDTVSDMNTWIANSTNKATLKTGDVFLIRALDVPDYWWDGTANSNTGDICQLETTKVDLTGYVPITTTINGNALSSNITITAASLNVPTKPSSPTSGNYVTWDNNGNLADSGYKIIVSNSAPASGTANTVITFVY